MTLHTLEEVTAAFLRHSPQSIEAHYTLERMRRLMSYLDNPQEIVPVIHLAGTSGKTSTAYFIRGMLEASGRRTGLTVSPHIVGINERIQIGGAPLPAGAFTKYAEGFLDFVQKTDLQPTYFELLVALAYKVFADEVVDYAVVETGLGGLLDGTNVVKRADKVCVITDIGLDHTEILGDTIEKIATQKAGIIQPGNHVIMNRQAPNVMRVFEATAKRQKATLQIVESDAPEGAELPLPKFQRRNWQLASAVFAYLCERDKLEPLSPEQRQHIVTQTPPGRWEIYRYRGKTIILDGAHNPQKLQAFCESLSRQGIRQAAFMTNLVQAPEQKVKDAIRVIQPFASHIIIPEFGASQDLRGRQSFSASEFHRYIEEAGITDCEEQPELTNALDALLARPEDTLVIVGSLYLVSAIRPLIMRRAAEFTPETSLRTL